jgi:hypothetical protein
MLFGKLTNMLELPVSVFEVDETGRQVNVVSEDTHKVKVLSGRTGR